MHGAGRVWDMRTGRSIMALQGHVQGILTLDFSPDGYHVASGSEDHSCRIWDLRKRGCVYVLPAHNSLISQVSHQAVHRICTCFRVLLDPCHQVVLVALACTDQKVRVSLCIVCAQVTDEQQHWRPGQLGTAQLLSEVCLTQHNM